MASTRFYLRSDGQHRFLQGTTDRAEAVAAAADLLAPYVALTSDQIAMVLWDLIETLPSGKVPTKPVSAADGVEERIHSGKAK